MGFLQVETSGLRPRALRIKIRALRGTQCSVANSPPCPKPPNQRRAKSAQLPKYPKTRCSSACRLPHPVHTASGRPCPAPPVASAPVGTRTFLWDARAASDGDVPKPSRLPPAGHMTRSQDKTANARRRGDIWTRSHASRAEKIHEAEAEHTRRLLQHHMGGSQ
jgi:hypothetical protein